MGIFDDIHKHLVDEGGVNIVNDMGKPVIFFPRIEPGSKLQWFMGDYEIMRGDLCRILCENTNDTAISQLGLSVDEFHDTGDAAVQVKLSDGVS
ncbi:hypothetical protein E5D57_002932 [Metarhizium anisopliae]|nr:hypothetical protein E5D57_002932 [Metarhizium anisopliae]